MRVIVKAKPGARENKIEMNADGSFAVWVIEPPVQGRANQAIAEILSQYFNVPRSSVRLVMGRTSRQKVFEILS